MLKQTDVFLLVAQMYDIWMLWGYSGVKTTVYSLCAVYIIYYDSLAVLCTSST